MNLFNDIHLKNLRGDFFGGLSAAVVALPLGLAFGVSSGLGPEAGLYSAILVGLFASIFGGTPAQISGPTGPMTVVMAGVVTQYLAADPENGYASAFAVVVMAGAFQIAFGALKLGKYIVQVSYPVISGFMSGIGVIIIVLQLRPFVGLETLSAPLDALMDIPNLFLAFKLPDLILAALALTLAFVWRGRLNNILPSPVLLILVGTIAALMIPFFNSVPTIGAISSGLPTPHIPHFSAALILDEIAMALLIATLGSIDSLLTSLVADSVSDAQHDSDKELIGQGIGNFIAGFFGALPGAGATMRTIVNVKSGGKTALSGVFHSLLIVAVILGAGPLAANIPTGILAAILIKVGIDIIDRRFLKKLHLMPLFSAGLMLLVLLLTVFVDLITAVFVGIFISNMVTVDRLTDTQLDNIRFLTDSNPLLDKFKPRFEKILMIELNGPISFGVSRGINRRLAEQGHHDALMIDLSNAQLLGITTALLVLDILEDEQAKGRTVLINEHLDETVFANLHKLGIFDRIKPEDRF